MAEWRPAPSPATADGLPDWDRLRLSLNNALGELLHGWGLLASLRRRTAPRPPRSPAAAPRPPPAETIEMSSFNCRVVSNSPLAGGGRAICRVASAPVVNGMVYRRQQWHEASDSDSGVCVDRDWTVGSNGVLLWEEFDGTGSGEGHLFVTKQLLQPSWCDCCGDLLWADALVCKYCSYTCHQRCRDLVTLDCPSDASSDLGLSEVTDPSRDEDLLQVQTLVNCDSATVAEVRHTDTAVRAAMIETYNATTTQGLYMTVLDSDEQQTRSARRRRKTDRERRLSIVSINDDGSEDLVVRDIEWSDDGASFRGFIRVHMNLFRPINMVAGTRPPSIYDVLQTEPALSELTLERTLASFYLPRDTVKALHIDNETTVQEVISSLLKKFKIVDDPRKFALYERFTEQSETTKVKMRRLADCERPLELALTWSHNGVTNKKFVLQENDTGDILWDNFTLPELNNFLLMLNREEEDYKRRVRQKYSEMKRRIGEHLSRLHPTVDGAQVPSGPDPAQRTTPSQ